MYSSVQTWQSSTSSSSVTTSSSHVTYEYFLFRKHYSITITQFKCIRRKLKVSQNFILQQNLEPNISLHHGSKSAELYNNSSTLLTSHLDSDVNKVILCSGTNDIANLPFTSHTVTESTQHVTDVVSKFNNPCDSKMQLSCMSHLHKVHTFQTLDFC